MAVTKKNIQPIEQLCSNVLQALMYWVGYKKRIFPYYHFSEGAITSELYTLFSSLDKNKLFICPEFLYKKIPSSKSKNNNSLIEIDTGKERVDILLLKPKSGRNLKKDNNDNFQILPSDKLFLFEVKKFESKNDISNDFKKLHQSIEKNKNVRGFMILLNQDTLPPIGKNVKVENEEKVVKNWEKRINHFVKKNSTKYKTRIVSRQVASSAKKGITSHSNFGVLVEVVL